MASSEMSAACWLEMTTVSIRTGRCSASYSTVTWVLPSGRR
jgi:hypothetical protein